ncbi:MAG: hypothetical protein ACK5PC_19740 [Cyclobacteriaceae bacterium]|jgi:hypothetical protein
MKEDLNNQIIKVVNDWSSDLQGLAKREDIVSINFGAQKVFDGYEFYLSGHTWFDGHDLWLLDEEWNPSINYVSIGPDSLRHDRLDVLETLEKVIQNELIQSAKIYEKLIVTVGLSDSDYKRLK